MNPIQKILLLLVIGLGSWVEMPAQTTSLPAHQASRRVSPIALDGKLDEQDWQVAYVTEGFRQTFPNYLAEARGLTRVRILFDEKNLYVGARLLKSSPDQKIMTRLNRRDQRNEGADSFFIGLDPILSRRSAYVFGVTAAGVQFDFIVNDSQGDRGFDYAWDAVWESAVSIDDEGWSVEMRIPLSVMKIPIGSSAAWGFNPCRADNGQAKEESKWYVQPRDVSSGIANYPFLQGIEQLTLQPKREWTPFVVAKKDISRSEPNRNFQSSLNFGLDARLSLPNNAQLDLAIQPDFGQVEVDQTVFNLSALETSFPEKRPFFTEGSDIFQISGPPFFYSRRIGQPTSAPTIQDGEQLLSWDSSAVITGAAKYTSKSEGGLNIGILGANTKTAEAFIRSANGSTRIETLLPSTNYGVMRVSQALDDRGSFIGGFASWVNRSGQQNKDALITSVDGVWREKDQSFEGTLSNSKVGPPGQSLSDWRGRLSWSKRWSNGSYFFINPVYAGPNFQLNDLGYQSRTDEKRLSMIGGRTWDKPIGMAENMNINVQWNLARDGANHLIKNDMTLTSRFNTRDFYRVKLDGFIFGYQEDDYELRTFSDLRKKYLPRGAAQGLRFEVESPQYNAWQWEIAVGGVGGEKSEKGFQMKNEFQLSDQWKIDLTHGLKKTRGDYWFETRAGAPVGFITGMSDTTPIIGDRDLTEFTQLLRASYTANARLTVQMTAEWVGVNYVYSNLRSYLRDGIYASAGLSQRSRNESFRSWVVNVITRWEYAPGSSLFIVYGKNTINSDIISMRGGLSPFSDLTMLQRTPSDDTIQIKISHLFR